MKKYMSKCKVCWKELNPFLPKTWYCSLSCEKKQKNSFDWDKFMKDFLWWFKNNK